MLKCERKNSFISRPVSVVAKPVCLVCVAMNQLVYGVVVCAIH